MNLMESIMESIRRNPAMALLALGALLLAVFLLYGWLSPKPVPGITNISFSVGTGSNPVLGNPAAKITIVEFIDYQCPYCARHATRTFPQIESNYINAGKAKYYIRDFPIHGNSQGAAAAARCAGEQGKYWEMHALLFQNQQEWGPLQADELGARFLGYASSLGMSGSAFASCYSSGRYDAQISQDAQEGSSYGISGTPSFVIILPKTANEAKLLAVLGEYPDYSSQGILSLSRDPQGNYIFFVKGAFPYLLFKEVLDA